MPLFIDPDRMVVVERTPDAPVPSEWVHVDDVTAAACHIVDGQRVTTRQAAALRGGWVASFWAADPREDGPSASPRTSTHSPPPPPRPTSMWSSQTGGPSLWPGVLILVSCVLVTPFVLAGAGLLALGVGFCGDRVDAAEIESCQSGAVGSVVIYLVVMVGLLVLGVVVGIKRIRRARAARRRWVQ